MTAPGAPIDRFVRDSLTDLIDQLVATTGLDRSEAGAEILAMAETLDTEQAVRMKDARCSARHRTGDRCVLGYGHDRQHVCAGWEWSP